MANMALNIEQRLGQRLSLAQIILWTNLLSRWPNMTIQPYVFNGAPGAPLTVYSANILYVAVTLAHSSTGGIWGVSAAATYYNELNVAYYSEANSYPMWDTVANIVRFINNPYTTFDIWFSRITESAPYIKFVGYQLTI